MLLLLLSQVLLVLQQQLLLEVLPAFGLLPWLWLRLHLAQFRLRQAVEPRLIMWKRLQWNLQFSLLCCCWVCCRLCPADHWCR